MKYIIISIILSVCSIGYGQTQTKSQTLLPPQASHRVINTPEGQKLGKYVTNNYYYYNYKPRRKLFGRWKYKRCYRGRCCY